jgi:hypothetical protein
LKILFLATYFPRPRNPTIGTWALEQAKAFQRASEEAPLRVASGDQSAGGAPATSNLALIFSQKSLFLKAQIILIKGGLKNSNAFSII